VVRLVRDKRAKAQASFAKLNLKPSRLYLSEIANSGLALFISREALLLHSNSSRVDALSEQQELTLKPHSWSRAVFRIFSEGHDRQKRSVFRV
jgi:hypothetical protein